MADNLGPMAWLLLPVIIPKKHEKTKRTKNEERD